MNQLDALLYVFLGWLLGMLSPVIIEHIRRRYRIAELRAAINAELIELRYQMATVSFLMHNREDDLSDAWLDWFERIVSGYTGPLADPTFAEFIRVLRTVPEPDRLKHFAGDESRGLTLKEYSLPLLAAHMGEIALFPIKFQSNALRVRAQLDIYNQHSHHLQELFRMTFLKVDDHENLTRNLKEGYLQVGKMSKSLADAITRALP